MLEVELKFPLADPAAVLPALEALGVSLGEPQEQVDRYFKPPWRDFAGTDEALRLRTSGQAARITYKGPRLHRTTKTRREIELPLAGGAQEVPRWHELLAALGLLHVADVQKTRRKARLTWQGFQIEIAMDTVAHLGSFIELETLAEPHDVQRAQAAVHSLAERLGLANPEPRSYLELLLAARA